MGYARDDRGSGRQRQRRRARRNPDGLWFAQPSDDMLGQALAAGELVKALPEYRHDCAPVVMSRRKVRSSPPKVQAFNDYFVGRFASTCLTGAVQPTLDDAD